MTLNKIFFAYEMEYIVYKVNNFYHHFCMFGSSGGPKEGRGGPMEPPTILLMTMYYLY